MSFWSKIVGIEHTFTAWVAKELTAIEGAEPKIERVVDATLSYAGPALQMVLQATGQTVASGVVGNVISQAQSDMKVASALVYDFGPTPTAASAFSAVQNNLMSLLSAGHVTDPKSVQAVQKVVNEIGAVSVAVGTAATQIQAAAAPVPPVAPASPAPVAANAQQSATPASK